MAKTIYPVGASWKATTNHGIGRVWLDRRIEGMEVWYYSWSYPDGSGQEYDWAPSHRKAMALCRTLFRVPVRLKREK